MGRSFTFQNQNHVEIESRISAAWKKFYALKDELLSKKYSLYDRIRLFNGVVTPTALYGCTSWTLTVELENRLKRTQRQMLRMMLQRPRRPQVATKEHDEGSDEDDLESRSNE